MQRRAYHFATSKSDDILYHHEVQEKQQSLRESQIRRISVDQRNVDHQKRASHYSITFRDESKKVSQAHIKKKLLTQIAQYGFNAYMAEYLIEKQKISLDQDYTKLLNFVIEEIHRSEQQYKSCQKLKQSTYRQIMPVSFEDQEQIDRFIEEPRSEAKVEQELICGICMCEFVDKKKALNCQHEFCTKCLQDYLDNKINVGSVLEIECAQQGCDNYFSDEIIKNLVNDEQYQKFEKFKQMRLLEKDETVRWCVRPGCDKFVKGNMFCRVVKCECGQEMCYDCRREEHPGLTCDQALDKYYEQTLKQLIIQRCPKCKAPIQKKEGCNHMTCYQCRFQFCWLCRARYTRMHFDSDNCFGCPDKQFSTDDPQPRPRWKKYGGIIFEIFASILILPLLPFILIYYSVMGPLKLLKHFRRPFYRRLDDGDKLCILLFGLLTFPISMVLLIFPGALLFLAYKLKYD